MNPIPKQITKFEDFIKIVPKAVQCFDKSYTRWARDLTNQELVTELVAEFREENDFFYEEDKNGEALYFFVILKKSPEKLNFWIIYVAPRARAYTKPLLDYLTVRYKKRGFKLVDFVTTRLTQSYKRWAKKFNAHPYAITYHINLEEVNIDEY